jgi:methionine synthase / methylenetetrahydrofolate reductase(NADPH)
VLRLLPGHAAGVRVPLLLLVTPLTGFTHAEHLRHEVPDVVVPDPVLARMRAAGDDAAEAIRAGLELAERLVDDTRDLTDGIVVRRPGDAAGLGEATARLRAALAGPAVGSRS